MCIGLQPETFNLDIEENDILMTQVALLESVMIQHMLEVDSLAIPGDDKCVQHENKGQTTAFLHIAKSVK